MMRLLRASAIVVRTAHLDRDGLRRVLVGVVDYNLRGRGAIERTVELLPVLSGV